MPRLQNYSEVAMPRGKGGGRPVRQKGTPLLKSQTFRLSTAMDTALRKAAKESKRSISEEIQFLLEQALSFRLSAVLAEQIRRETAESGRSFNEEVEFRLTESFKPRTDFHLRRDYAAVAASYKLIVAQADILRKQHPELEPIYQEVAANWAAIEGEEDK
jgi:hypothetical protein